MTESIASPTYRRFPIAIMWILICVLGMWFTSRFGYARLLARYASLTGNTGIAARAVDLAPLDSQTHNVRSTVLYGAGLPEKAASELELAVSLRPRDDYLWLQLGVIRDELHHPGALPAFNESVRLAPYYGHPKWQRGNYLLRTGDYDAAFSDLRSAAASNQNLVPSLIDLAWGVSRQNAELTQNWAGVNDDQKRIAFARFLATQGRGSQALAQFRASRVVNDQARRELMRALIATGSFREAFEIWRGLEGADGSLTAVHDGGFEISKTFDDSGFGWRFASASQGARISLDTNHPRSGKQSLRVTFLGFSEPNTSLLSQLLLVESHKRYRVNFGARAENLITGGLPLFGVYEVAGKKRLLGQSEPIGFESSGWRSFSFDFPTEEGIEAIELRLQRKQCNNNAPCPIFGSLWLDDFTIEEIR